METFNERVGNIPECLDLSEDMMYDLQKVNGHRLKIVNTYWPSHFLFKCKHMCNPIDFNIISILEPLINNYPKIIYILCSSLWIYIVYWRQWIYPIDWLNPIC